MQFLMGKKVGRAKKEASSILLTRYFFFLFLLFNDSRGNSLMTEHFTSYRAS